MAAAAQAAFLFGWFWFGVIEYELHDLLYNFILLYSLPVLVLLWLEFVRDLFSVYCCFQGVFVLETKRAQIGIEH